MKEFWIGVAQFAAASCVLTYYVQLEGARYWACMGLCVVFKLIGWREGKYLK